MLIDIKFKTDSDRDTLIENINQGKNALQGYEASKI